MRSTQEKEISRCQNLVDGAEFMAKTWQQLVDKNFVVNHGHLQEFTDDYLELSGALEALDAYKTLLRAASSHPEFVPKFEKEAGSIRDVCSTVFQIAERFNSLAADQIKNS
ncbi:MAG: hypothetical protein J0L73_23560 [Verrucomicrobia bacterium]|nr:hypothetical protein [Verrucomicrobiota bacterium]